MGDKRGVGDRITERMTELELSRTNLSKKASVKYSTLAGILSGAQKRTTQLPEIAAALGLHPLWLQEERGPRLLTEKPAPIDTSTWPFSFSLSRLENLDPTDLELIDSTITSLLNAIDRRQNKSVKSQVRKKSISNKRGAA